MAGEATLPFTYPGIYSAGVSYSGIDCLTVAMDLRYVDYANDANVAMSRTIGIPFCRALQDFAEGKYGACVDRRLRVRQGRRDDQSVSRRRPIE